MIVQWEGYVDTAAGMRFIPSQNSTTVTKEATSYAIMGRSTYVTGKQASIRTHYYFSTHPHASINLSQLPLHVMIEILMIVIVGYGDDVGVM